MRRCGGDQAYLRRTSRHGRRPRRFPRRPREERPARGTSSWRRLVPVLRSRRWMWTFTLFLGGADGHGDLAVAESFGHHGKNQPFALGEILVVLGSAIRYRSGTGTGVPRQTRTRASVASISGRRVDMTPSRPCSTAASTISGVTAPPQITKRDCGARLRALSRSSQYMGPSPSRTTSQVWSARTTPERARGATIQGSNSNPARRRSSRRPTASRGLSVAHTMRSIIGFITPRYTKAGFRPAKMSPLYPCLAGTNGGNRTEIPARPWEPGGSKSPKSRFF